MIKDDVCSSILSEETRGGTKEFYNIFRNTYWNTNKKVVEKNIGICSRTCTRTPTRKWIPTCHYCQYISHIRPDCFQYFSSSLCLKTTERSREKVSDKRLGNGGRGLCGDGVRHGEALGMGRLRYYYFLQCD